ncbi:unnamed protein product [Phytomonas sp. EM1]|nr:unnamed protein product [Phytomonas sp. EM1]|eukprot:CCW61552.1 unnamed protein product [Phytomonas sp. isolate EM1]
MLIDLVPLQETMVCKNYKNTTDCPERYFSMDYQSAREKFLKAARAVNAETKSHIVFTRDDMRYFTDSAFLKGEISDKLLVHVCGIRGVEGYIGSAIQNKILEDWSKSSSGRPSVLFIHAVNPYGMAHNRLLNEEAVDLNHNYILEEEWDEIKHQNSDTEDYIILKQLQSATTAPRLIDRYLFFLHLIKIVVKYGWSPLKKSIITGQHQDPNVIFYGGNNVQSSIRILQELMQTYSKGVTEAIFMNIQTGTGSNRKKTILVHNKNQEEIIKEIFKKEQVQSVGLPADAMSGGHGRAAGAIRLALGLAPKTLIVTEEFGTSSPLSATRAVALEGAAYHACPGSYVHHVMGTWLREAFYPQETKYKKMVLSSGIHAFEDAVHYLSNAAS